MSARRIAVVPGDGVGPEIMEVALAVIEAAGFHPEWVPLKAGQESLLEGGPALPPETIAAIREIGIALKSPTMTPIGEGHVSANVQLRKELDLYANVRPAKSLPGIPGPLLGRVIDIIVVRENTEDLYSGIEFMVTPDIAQGIKVITRSGSQRISHYAFEMARQQGRKRVTAVHKANIMKKTDGLFLEEFRKAAAAHSDIEAGEIIVDNCCMQLVSRPEQFDVLVTENLYGDIVSDLCAGLVGGLGVAPGANIGENCAVFEAVHGTAPDIAGKNIVNPTGLLFSALMMLRNIDQQETANRIGKAMVRVLRDAKVVTRDLGGTASTTEFRDAIIANMA